ncbi:zinc dependent phospholipase C family protein [Planococcus sp. ANT_H30]|uniref:zinc dependent phospholipase C family protein n=1 Tax=Planococcus sp. ANT_H30 TaxID=2597347 RepID=UPI0011EF07C0|nr:zinc dependent phospholipase C family protein [Planococcus sp. ANT_H30]KAA0955195.1 zinc dependent phospholipase C family protein [Planococcus sp. ANT_H30]
MGSRIMHLIIADKVSKKLPIENKQVFLLGAISPDAAFTRKRKTDSHFFEGSLEDGTRFVNYKRFIEKYPTEILNEYALGYLTHLISDDVWMKQVYFKNNFKNRVDADPRLLERWHNDFRKLNGKLIEWFNCRYLKDELVEDILFKSAIDEIKLEDLKKFKEETLEDFIYSQEDLLKELEVYSFQQISGYIDFSIKEVIDVWLSLNKESTSSNLL